MLCLSKNQINSGWSYAEYGSMLNNLITGNSKQRVLPLILDELLVEDMPILLRSFEVVRYSNKNDYKDMLQFFLRDGKMGGIVK